MGTALLPIVALHAGGGHAQTVAAPPKDAIVAADAAEAASAAKDEILVTAHLQHGAVATEIPPEVSLNSAVIQSLGAADLTEVFRELAPEIGAAPGAATGQAGTAIVLVNGQRIAGFSSIKDFPPESVRRIEIFPEQVALQYGYGPNQRVVNVVLRTEYRALTLLGRYTVAPDNWRGLYRAKVDLLRIGEDSHSNFALDFSHQDPILADTTLAGPAALARGGPIPRHTLAPQDDRLTVSAASTRMIGNVAAELTGSLDLETLQSRPGLTAEDGDILAQEGLSDLVSGPFDRVDRTVHAQTNLTLNGKIDSWRWSVIGRLDDSARETRTGDAFATGGLSAVDLPSPTLLGDRCGVRTDPGCVSTNSRAAGADLYLNGSLFAMPAGAVTLALRTGFSFAGLRGDSTLQSTDLDRVEGSFGGNVEVPLTSRSSGLGKLSVGVNGTAQQLSAFGTLSTVGATVNWSPIIPVSVLASYSRAEDAPTLLQLGEARLVTPDLRDYDFAAGSTAVVQRIEGGNTGLTYATSRLAKVRVQVMPLRATDLTLSAEYTSERIRNPIASLTAATTAAMAAFPTRFTRMNGPLAAIDVSPLNLARRDSQQVRWGLTYSSAFGGAWRGRNGAPADPTKPIVRDQVQIAVYDTWKLQDDVVLRDGLARLDLLGGATIGDGGGTPTHRVELQTTVSTHPVSADVSAAWQTPTTVRAGAFGGQALTFSQGITLNLRVQINLADEPWLTRRIPWLRGSLNISADNLLGAHTKVHDVNGVVPLAYAESYLNPIGRTFRITLRKRFR